MPQVDTSRHRNPLQLPEDLLDATGQFYNGTYFPPVLDRPVTSGGRDPDRGLTTKGMNWFPDTIARGTAWELVSPRWRNYPGQGEIGLAVMEAESGFNAKAVSPNGCCVGLWQINLRAHGISRRCAESPVCSSDVALRIFKDARRRGGTGWEPWEAYTNGSYKKYLGKTTIQDASAVEEGLTLSGPGCGVLPDAICSIVQGFGILFDRHFWIRVLKILAGLVAVGLAIGMIAKEYLPAGRLLKGATGGT